MMDRIQIVEREMTAAEFACMNAGFEELALEHGNPVETAERYGFVVPDGETFIGCVSSLAVNGRESRRPSSTSLPS